MTRERPKAAAKLFESAYGERVLHYKVIFPGLRRMLRRFLRTRHDVAKALALNFGGSSILDFGCGAGELIFDIADQTASRFSRFVGIDISNSNVARAYHTLDTLNSSARAQFSFICGDESAIAQLSQESIDCVLCIATFLNIYDVYGLAKELRRVLKPEGFLVTEFVNSAYIRHRIRLLAGRFPTITFTSQELWPTIGWDGSVLHHFTLKTIERFLVQSNFQIVKIVPTGLLYNLVRIWPSLLATGFVIVARKKN